MRRSAKYDHEVTGANFAPFCPCCSDFVAWKVGVDVTFRATRQLSLSMEANNLLHIRPRATVPSVLANGTVFNGAVNAGSLPYLLNPTLYGFNGAFYYGKVSWKF